MTDELVTPPDDGEALRQQIEDLQAALDAIGSGGVDAVLIGPPGAQQVYTLSSADRPYRLIVENIGEGAATVTESRTNSSSSEDPCGSSTGSRPFTTFSASAGTVA